MSSEVQVEEEEVKQEQLANLGSLNITQQIKATQSSNGLKHQDYHRYRKYCVQRVKRIRKTMKFSYGKRYNKRSISVEARNDPRLLQYLLFSAEKSWAHAMFLKSQTAIQGNKKKNTKRAKFHLRRKFKRAVAYSSALREICNQRTDQRTALESDSYASFLEGSHYFEVEKWDSALTAFLRCRQIYGEILKVCDSMQAVLYREKMEQIDQSIRYCNYRTNKQGALMTVESLLDMKAQIKDPSLVAKIEEMLEENRKQILEKTQGLIEIEYHGEKLPVKNQRVILALEKARETLINIQLNCDRIGACYTSQQQSEDQIIELQDQNLESYISLFSLYDDAIKFVSKDKEDPQNSEAEKAIFVKLLSYINLQRQFAVLARNDIHVKQSLVKFIREDGANNLQNLSTKKAIKHKLTSPQEIVKYCDNYQQVLKQIMEVERLNPDITIFKKMDVLEFYSKAIRLFFVACLYFVNEKYQESVSLFKYCDDIFKISSRKYKENVALFATQNLDLEVQNLAKLSQNLQLKCKLNAIKQQHSTQKDVGIKMDQLTLQEPQVQRQKSLFQLSEVEQQEVAAGNVFSYRFADLTERTQFVAPKPIFFDLAYDFLAFPPLEEKKEDPKKGGFWGRINIFKR